MLNTLEKLIKLARDRKSSPVEGSYTNKLLSDKSLSKAKVLEEVDELIEAIEEDTNKIHEAADVFYHLLIYLEANNVKIEDVMAELDKIKKLVKLARDRKSSPVEGSYTNKLLSDKSLSKAKVLEEVDELIEAIEEDTNKIHEAADVFYHLLMYLEANDVKIEDVMAELDKRKK